MEELRREGYKSFPVMGSHFAGRIVKWHMGKMRKRKYDDMK